MKTILSASLALLMIVGVVFVGDAISSNGTASVNAQQVTVRHRRHGVATRTYRGGKKVVRKTWHGTKYVGRKTWHGTKWTGKKVVKGTRWTSHKTKRTTKHIFHKTRKVVQ